MDRPSKHVHDGGPTALVLHLTEQDGEMFDRLCAHWAGTTEIDHRDPKFQAGVAAAIVMERAYVEHLRANGAVDVLQDALERTGRGEG